MKSLVMYQEEIKNLMSELITCVKNPKNDKKIIDIYLENFNYYKSNVDISDVVYDINDYNIEILKQVAELEYCNEMEKIIDNYTEHEHIIIINKQEELMSYYWPHLFEDLEYYVIDLLKENQYPYLIPTHYEIFDCLFGNNKDVIMIVNDYQNTLIEEFGISYDLRFEDISTGFYLEDITIWRI